MIDECEALGEVAAFCQTSKGEFPYVQRMKAELSLFRIAKTFALNSHGYLLHSLSRDARLSYAGEIDGQTTRPDLVERVFELTAVGKTLCLGNPYEVDSMFDDYFQDKEQLLRKYAGRIRRLVLEAENFMSRSLQD